MYDDAGTLTSFIGTTSDITKLKQIEGELLRAREAAEAANRAKDEFLAKPIEAAALWAAMERLVAARPSTRRGPAPVEPGLIDARAILRACGDEAAVLETACAVFRRSLPAQMSRARTRWQPATWST